MIIKLFPFISSQSLSSKKKRGGEALVSRMPSLGGRQGALTAMEGRKAAGNSGNFTGQETKESPTFRLGHPIDKLMILSSNK